MLRHIADLKILLWMVASTTLFFFLWNSIEFYWPLYIVYLYFSICFSIFAHNHNHLGVWKSNILNHIHNYWLTIFNGYPAFAWIATHNRNHHRYNNSELDSSKTYVLSEKNNLFTLSVYPFLSSIAQQKVIIDYYLEQYGKNWGLFISYTIQVLIFVLWVIGAFILDWQKALLYVVLPQQVSLAVVVIFNYIQHVHADEKSKYNHSRNIVGKPLNFLLFNNGLHTIHHIQPNLHWSKLPAAHKKIEHHIDPFLKEEYLFWYLIRVYILGLFIPKFRTNSMRLARKKNELSQQTH